MNPNVPNRARFRDLFLSLLLVASTLVSPESFADVAAGQKALDRRDYDTAFKEFRSSAEHGDRAGQAMLGFAYYQGGGVAKDHKQAIEWFRKAADQGEARAQEMLGLMYNEGDAVAKDKKQAAVWFRKAAEQGRANAQNMMGSMYRSGEGGLPKDKNQAIEWFRRSAAQGDANGQYNLGLMYYNGEGVTQDKKQAMVWFQKSANQGNALGQTNLGSGYYNGEGVKPDRKQAIIWLTKAAKQGNVDAQRNLAVINDDVKRAAERKKGISANAASGEVAEGDIEASKITPQLLDRFMNTCNKAYSSSGNALVGLSCLAKLNELCEKALAYSSNSKAAQICRRLPLPAAG